MEGLQINGVQCCWIVALNYPLIQCEVLDSSVFFSFVSRTLTTPVELIKCLKSIKEHAFSASPYPVIITLEDHLTPDLQAKVAQVVFRLLLEFQP